MLRKVYFIGLVVYLILLVFSIIFYKERVILLDTAFTTFHIANTHNFFIAIYRFGNVFIEALPVFAAKAGLSLNAIMTGFSAGVVLYYLVCYVLCGSVFRRYDWALLILLVSTLFATDTFYWMPSELPQGMALLAVLFAMTGSRQPSELGPLRTVVLLAGLVTVAFYHPMLVLVIFYALVYMYTTRQLAPDRKLLILTGALFLGIIVLKETLFRTPYEHHSLSGLKNFVTLFPNYFTIYSNKKFLADCLTKYYWIPVLFIAIILVYARHREWRRLAAFACFFAGYLFLVNITYPKNITPPFYRENLYLPMAFFLGLPFVFEIVPLLEKRKLAAPVIILILLTGIVRIYFAHTTYTARLDYERKCLDEYGERKVIAKASDTDRDVLQMLWGTPYELLLLSECERHKPASIIIDDAPELRPWIENVHNALVVNWNTFKYSELDSRYFLFTDSVTSYTIIK